MGFDALGRHFGLIVPTQNIKTEYFGEIERNKENNYGKNRTQ